MVAILLGVQLVGFVGVEGFAGRHSTHVGTTASLRQRCRPNPTRSRRQPFPLKHDRHLRDLTRSALHTEPSSSSGPANDNVVRCKMGFTQSENLRVDYEGNLTLGRLSLSHFCLLFGRSGTCT
jgi:hypothetical protein